MAAMPTEMTKRIDEAHKRVRAAMGTSGEDAALAYLRAQVEIAKRKESDRGR